MPTAASEPRNSSNNRLARRHAVPAGKPRFLPVEIPRFQPPAGSLGSRHPFWEATALSYSSIGALLRKCSTSRSEQSMAWIRWRAVVQSSGSIALKLLTFVCSRPRLNVATAACRYRVSVLVWAGASFISGGRSASFFSPAIFSFRVSDPTKATAILAFLMTLVVPAQVEAHE
jgi:hypothetical protein